MIRIFTVIMFLAGLSLPLNAASLDDLFDQLKTAETSTQAANIEENIWQFWLQGSTDTATEQLASAVRAMNQGELTLALVLLDELIETTPTYAEAWNKRATLHYIMGNFRQSFADIEQTIALEPRHFGAWSGMGLMFEQLGQIDAAIKAHQAVLDIYPASPFSQMKVEALTKQQRRDSI